ncbi:hypothetical protein CEXT_434531 [Caerostris extrusa]|uniref:Uncharacterized protein n=1 Tax=Caerostris extrusa TaxID=172846 RepID=A0AAV4R8D0_CAEEX|nr:hypothetical protein CEXT_434531 [Caerostris extrusa]
MQIATAARNYQTILPFHGHDHTHQRLSSLWAFEEVSGDEFMNIIHFQRIIILKLQGFDVGFCSLQDSILWEQLGQIFG